MFAHHLSTAWRNFVRFKSTTLINVFGLSLGLSCFVAANGMLTYLRSSEKQLPNENRIVSIWMQTTDSVAAIHGPFMPASAQAFAPSVRKEFPNVTIAYVERTTMPVVVNGQRKPIGVSIVDPDFLTVLDMPRFQSTANNPLLAPRGAVIGEEAALQLFGTTHVLGKTVRLRDAVDVTITGVFKDLKPYIHTNFSSESILISRETSRALQEAMTHRPANDPPLSARWIFTFSSEVYALLPPDGSLSARELETRLEGIAERNGSDPAFSYNFKVVPLADFKLAAMHLNLLNGNGAFTLESLISILAYTVLAVACANYANLAYAQTSLQAKEVGLRKIIGASRWQLVRQSILEAFLQLVVAGAVAVLLVLVVGRIIQTRLEIPVLSSVIANIEFWMSTLISLLALVLLVAIYPAFSLARARPAHALRANENLSASSPGTRILIGAQFIIAGALLVVLVIVSMQNFAVQSRAVRAVDDVVVTLGFGYRSGGAQFEAWRTELLQSPAIKAVSSTSNPPWSNSFAGLMALKVRQGRILNPNLTFVGYDLEKVIDLQFIAGRPFERGGPTQGVAIVDTTLAEHLGFATPADAIGQFVTQGGRNENGPALMIVGVVKDKSLRLVPVMDFVGTIYIPESASSSTPIIRIDKNRVGEGIAAIDATWKRLNPSMPVERTFADEAFARNYAVFKIIGTALTVVTSMALIVSVLGAFNFANFFASRRAHEIGVRKTLGASVARILALLARDFSKPVLVASLFSWPLAYVAVSRYLLNFEERIEITIWPFLSGALFMLLVVWLAVGKQSLKTACMNPAKVLRRE